METKTAAGSGVCVRNSEEIYFMRLMHVVFHERKKLLCFMNEKKVRCQCDPRIDKSIRQITFPCNIQIIDA